MDMQAEPGTYILLMLVEKEQSIVVGSLGELQLLPGWYAYVGSAFGPGGVRARCLRHLRGGRPHWHMDYLRPQTQLLEIWFTHDWASREHDWAGLMLKGRGQMTPFEGFGASDCDCTSHLSFSLKQPSFSAFKRRVHAALPDHSAIHRWLLPVEQSTPGKE